MAEHGLLDSLRARLARLEDKSEPNRHERSALRFLGMYRTLKGWPEKSRHAVTARTWLRLRQRVRDATAGSIQFVTVDDAQVWTAAWLKTFRERYDVVIGIPRSGMFVASLIALKLGLPLTTPEGFAAGRTWRSAKVEDGDGYSTARRVLLVDDSIVSGATMNEASEIAGRAPGAYRIVRAALIGSEGPPRPDVDLVYRTVPHPRLFEWSLLHRKIDIYFHGARLASDMDGVLCENCPPGVDDNETRYRKWIANARPYLIPSYEVDHIVSNRLECYREATQTWLEHHGVRYGDLTLLDVPSKTERPDDLSVPKIELVLRTKPAMVWESSMSQARAIHCATNVPTLCTDEMTLLS